MSVIFLFWLGFLAGIDQTSELKERRVAKWFAALTFTVVLYFVKDLLCPPKLLLFARSAESHHAT